ncbi:MAG: hypothetical protein WDK96_01615 [Candidatus Paceibacterota bacterium]|jgi:gas vesicle protein
MKKINVKKVLKKKKMSLGKKMAIGAGVVTVGVGAYYLLGPKSKAHQKKALGLMKKMKDEVVKEAKKVKNSTESIYNKTIDSISANYNKQYKEHSKEINSLAKKLKGEWKDIKNQTSPAIKKVLKKKTNKKV